MKKLMRMVVVVATGCLWYACSFQQPVSVAPAQNNQDYQVEYLFEHDGCKVYRFYDRGYYIYFTNVKSDLTMMPNDSTRIINSVREDEVAK
jgi:hypothetical protein